MCARVCMCVCVCVCVHVAYIALFPGSFHGITDKENINMLVVIGAPIYAWLRDCTDCNDHCRRDGFMQSTHVCKLHGNEPNIVGTEQ